MRRRLRVISSVALVIIHAATAVGAGQTSGGSDTGTKAQSTAAARMTMPRTPWGDPDLQGIWTNVPITPVAPPVQQPDQPQTPAAPTAASVVGGGPQHWNEQRALVRMTQLPLVGPPGVKIPDMTPAGAARAAAIAATRDRRPDGPEDVTPWERCITRGIPGSMIPTLYNNNYQILQSPGYVVVRYEMIHDARIIPIGSPHLPPSIRQWNGDPRAHWEGTTLVVETTNFTDKTQINHFDGFHSARLRIIERFIPTDTETIDYQFTIDDPDTWTSPWTARLPLRRDRAQHSVLEYACHEGNYSIANMLSGARADDRKEENARKTAGDR